jgi:ribosomal protein S18 acetylase RimI-like enzyme
MMKLHEIAKEKGSEKVRLTVIRCNEKAIALYVKMGYAFFTKDAESLIGECSI